MYRRTRIRSVSKINGPTSSTTCPSVQPYNFRKIKRRSLTFFGRIDTALSFLAGCWKHRPKPRSATTYLWGGKKTKQLDHYTFTTPPATSRENATRRRKKSARRRGETGLTLGNSRSPAFSELCRYEYNRKGGGGGGTGQYVPSKLNSGNCRARETSGSYAAG